MEEEVNSLEASVAFLEAYTVKEEIGRGAFSRVSRCVEKATGRIFACKEIPLKPLRLRPSFDAQRLLREVTIMRELEHPNIVKLIDTFAPPAAVVHI